MCSFVLLLTRVLYVLSPLFLTNVGLVLLSLKSSEPKTHRQPTSENRWEFSSRSQVSAMKALNCHLNCHRNCHQNTMTVESRTLFLPIFYIKDKFTLSFCGFYFRFHSFSCSSHKIDDFLNKISPYPHFLGALESAGRWASFSTGDFGLQWSGPETGWDTWEFFPGPTGHSPWGGPWEEKFVLLVLKKRKTFGPRR